MKKKFVLLAGLLTLSCCAAGFAACGGGETTDPDAALKEDVLVNGFENWTPDLQTALIYNDFGKVSLNTDKQYVTEGERSARLDPLGGRYASSAAPIVMFSLKSDTYGFDYADLVYADYLSFDIYNAQDEDETIYAGFASDLNGVTSISRVGEKSFTLKPGWNSCELQVEASLLSIVGDLTEVPGVYFRFESAQSANVVEDGEGRTPRYYLDNMWLIKKPDKSETKFDVSLRENEIADFESLWQGYMFTNDNPGLVEVVEASDYGLTAPSGEKVLHAKFGGTNSGNWLQMEISSKLLDKTALFGMDAETAENAYICFETYNNTDTTVNLCMVYRTPTSLLLSTNNHCAPHTWTSYEYCVADLLAMENAFLTAMGNFQISYKDDYTGEKEYFFDNFRIEIRD